MLNRYIKRSKISEAKFRKLVRYFSADLEATQISLLTGLNRNTVNRYVNGIRERIAEYCESEAAGSLAGENEADESLFGTHRVKIWAGSGVAGRAAAVPSVRQDGKVHTRLLPDESKSSTKKSLIIGKVTRVSTIYCNSLPDKGEEAGSKTDNEFSTSLNRAKSIEGFLNIAKNRLAKFRGLNKSTFYLHLKECEFRYNYRNENLYMLILKLVRKKPLFEESV